jgi:PAT family beta-lactamase induction signal transducer AmpG
MVGAVGGGRLADRYGLRRLLFWLAALAGAPTLLYLALACYAPRSLAVVGSAVVAEQLAYGIASVGLKLVMMQALAAGPFPSAHFAFAAGLVSLGVTAGGMTSGVVQAQLGYRGFFLCAFLAALPAVAAAAWARRRVPDVKEDAARATGPGAAAPSGEPADCSDSSAGAAPGPSSLPSGGPS